MSTKVKKPLTLPRERAAKQGTQKQDLKDRATAFFAERRQAYAESVLLALCGNPSITENCTPAEIAGKSIEIADAMIDALYIRPIEAHNGVQEGE